MAESRGPGLVERLLGEVAMQAIVMANRLALRRGDLHEAEHLAAMLLYGNSNHDGGSTCYLPDNFWDLGRQFAAESRAYRKARRDNRG